MKRRYTDGTNYSAEARKSMSGKRANTDNVQWFICRLSRGNRLSAVENACVYLTSQGIMLFSDNIISRHCVTSDLFQGPPCC